MEHAVEVIAESLYEAVARGLRALHASPWVGEIGDGLTTVTVEVREPVPEKAEVRHHVHMKDFRQWLDAAGRRPRKSPREHVEVRSHNLKARERPESIAVREG